MSRWPLVQLGEVLTQYQEYIDSLEPRSYPKLSVKLYGKGVVLDAPTDGSDLKMQRHQIARAGQVILSEIWGKKGAIGLVPPEGQGALCTSHFFLFDIHEDRLEPKWLDAIFRANYLQGQLNAEARGTTGYAAVRPKHLLVSEIPLPPIDEQRRLVRKIQQLELKVAEAQHLRTAGPDGSALLNAEIGRAFRKLGLSCVTRQFREFEPHVTSGPRNWGSRIVSSGVRFYRAQDIAVSFEIANGSKAFIAPPDSDQGRSARLRPGDLMLVITGATVGRCALFREEAEPGYVNQHVAICRFSCPDILPRFVLWGLRGPAGQEQLLGQRYGQGKPGLNLNNIRAIELPVPDMAEQLRIVDYLDGVEARVKALDGLRHGAEAELNALLPSILDRAFRGEL